MVVVVGTVVGGAWTVVVVVARCVVVVECARAAVVVVEGERAVVVVLFARVVVVLVGGVVVVELEATEVVVVTALGALFAMKPTMRPDATPEPMKIVRVRRRTRAKRRSRCWGVRRWGVIADSSSTV
ncbi:MAG: hypothetical protein WA786_00015 [Acidimicrobiales bacterium]